MPVPSQLQQRLLRHVEWYIAALFAVVVLLVFHYRNQGRLMQQGALLEQSDSLYSTIAIYQTSDGLRHMVFGYKRKGYFESVSNPGDATDLELPYTRMMTVGLAYDPAPQSVLSIGMGGGAVSSYVLRFMPQPRFTEVELDPEVVRLARKYFNYRDDPRRTVVVEDGRKFLMGSPAKYDMILLDAYRGPYVPFHLLTREFYAEVSRHLAPGGVVVQNIDSATLLADSSVATLESSFQHTDAFHIAGNTVTVSYNGPQRSTPELQQTAAQLDGQFHFHYPLVDLLATRTPDPTEPNVKPLTDDFAPVDTLNAIDSHNRKWN